MSGTESTELGALVAMLRKQRGWTQSELAAKAGCRMGTIARIEQGNGQWSHRVARAIYEVLGTKMPFLESEAAAFYKLSRLNPLMDGRSLPTDDLLREIHAGLVVPPGQPQRSRGDDDQRPDPITLSPRLTKQLARLVLAIGEDGAIAAIGSFIEVARRASAVGEDDARETEPGARTLNVREPPVQKTTGRVPYVEERTRTVEVFDPEKPSRTTAKPRQRKAE